MPKNAIDWLTGLESATGAAVQTITTNDEVRETLRQLNRTMERLIMVLSTLNVKPTKRRSAELNGHDRELLLVTEFAKRVHRDKRTVYKWIRLRQMPQDSVVRVQGHLEIDWSAYEQSIRSVPQSHHET